MIRPPVVHDRFYPGDAETLKKTIRSFLPDVPIDKQKGIAAIVPHAGYIYSGSLAAKTLNCLTIPKTVLLLGPNHTGAGKPIALSQKSWQIPTGLVPPSAKHIENLLALDSCFTISEEAHTQEHSLEVQLPFLLEMQPELQIIPITLSHMRFKDCEHVARQLTAFIQNAGEDILIVMSNDMNHFKDHETTNRVDQLALEQIFSFDPEELYYTVIENKISMCGMIPVTIGLQTAINLGANDLTLIGYHDSGEISGDTTSVVGYAGITIS